MNDPRTGGSDPVSAAAREHVARRLRDARLDLEPASAAGGRMVGVAIKATTSGALQAEAQGLVPQEAEESIAEIRALVERWSALEPERAQAEWRTVATDPYAIAIDGVTRLVDDRELAATLASEEFADSMKTFPFYSPRRIEMSNVEVKILGATTANVTWDERELSPSGRVFEGSSAAIVVRQKDGWRVALFTKEGVYR